MGSLPEWCPVILSGGYPAKQTGGEGTSLWCGSGAMSALPKHPGLPLQTTDWQPETVQLLDESHLVAFSEFPRRRIEFAASIATFLQRQRDTEVCTLYGQYITDLESFCAQLERCLPGPSLLRRIDGSSGITSLLRNRTATAVRTPSKFRYYIWHDADVLLRANRALFGRLVDAMIGVGAEAEYASDDLLLLHRGIFVGSSLLDLYAEDPAGQFSVWAPDADGEPFWSVVTGVEKPQVTRYNIDALWT
jgi:hypothetical protein